MKTISAPDSKMDEPDNGKAAESSPEKYSFPFLKNNFEDTTLLTIITTRFIKDVFQTPYEINEFLRQSYLIGNKSLPLVGITGFIMGPVLIIQSRHVLAQFGAESRLPAIVGFGQKRFIGKNSEPPDGMFKY